jgi:hypothetical protein
MNYDRFVQNGVGDFGPRLALSAALGWTERDRKIVLGGMNTLPLGSFDRAEWGGTEERRRLRFFPRATGVVSRAHF